MKEVNEKSGLSAFLEICVMLLIIVIAFTVGFIMSRKMFLDIECNTQCWWNPQKYVTQDYVKLDREISDVINIKTAEKIEGTDNYNLKGIKYVPYGINEEEYNFIKTDKKYSLKDGEYQYVEEDGKEFLRNEANGKSYSIEKRDIKTYWLISEETGNPLLTKTEKFVYADVNKDVEIKNEDGEKIGTVEEYFVNYTPSENYTYYFEFDETAENAADEDSETEELENVETPAQPLEEKENTCTGIVRVESNIE